MKSSTFRRIKRRAARKGYRNPSAVAGKAYWRTEKAKYRKSRRGHHRYHRNRKGQFTKR